MRANETLEKKNEKIMWVIVGRQKVGQLYLFIISAFIYQFKKRSDKVMPTKQD
jgi:hypothetical protein